MGTIIAVCWVLAIHTLKWIAIKGNEFELLTVTRQQQEQLQQFQTRRVHYLRHKQSDAAKEDAPGGGDTGVRFKSIPDTDVSESRSPLNIATNSTNNDTRGEISDASRYILQRLIKRHDVGHLAKVEPEREVARTSPVIERQNLTHRRVPHLSSIAGQQQPKRQKPQPQQSANKNSDDSLMESLEDHIAREANNGDELSESPDQPTNLQSAQQSSDGYIDQAASAQIGDDQPKRVAGLVYRAPFFTSWFISTWNILYMPVFALISSCCFRNEDNTTKKLIV